MLNNHASSSGRIWHASHLLLCLLQVAAVSWALLTPDPYALVRGTSLGWLQSVSDLLQHTLVFTVLSATVFSLCLAIFGEFPPVAVFSMLGYCLFVEGLQAFVPGRTCDPRDAIANVTGFVLGLAIARVVSMLRPSVFNIPG
ncbi:MAG: VanZ family protein [Planctomycetaceae bacterium]